ncbi:hypothetical protein [Acetobacter malorum]|uniref:hypothetical protein n=1 Tax=Acetobacter malorum TaxID=178901 RepID=UPI0012E6F1E1|nr:hypothetical protein [Acetobacter malorum]
MQDTIPEIPSQLRVLAIGAINGEGCSDAPLPELTLKGVSYCVLLRSTRRHESTKKPNRAYCRGLGHVGFEGMGNHIPSQHWSIHIKSGFLP